MKAIAVCAALMLSTATAWAATTPAPAPAAPKPPAPAAAKPAAAVPPRDQLWFVAKVQDGALGYDAKSIKPNRELSTVEISSLFFVKAGNKAKSGTVFHYVLSNDTIDCIGTQFKPGSRLILDINGKVLDGGDAPPGVGWVQIANNPPLNALRGVACGGATFKGMTQAPNFAAALKTMKELK